MCKKLKASFTVEVTYILFFIFCAIAFIIGYAIDKHSEVVDAVELHLLVQDIAHDEKDIGYDKKRLKETAVQNIKGNNEIVIKEGLLDISGEMGDVSIRTSVFNPEAYLRATTALEGIYERFKGELSEKSKQ